MSRIDATDVDRDSLASADLVFFHGRGRSVTHVGIYVGENRFVHAPNKGGTVRLDSLDSSYWREHYAGAMRVRLGSAGSLALLFFRRRRDAQVVEQRRLRPLDDEEVVARGLVTTGAGT